jgi:hypothetical protein
MGDMIFMKRNLILFGAFLSAFILILIPNVGCVNSIVDKDEISNFKNIRSYDLKKTENILNMDCGCKDSKATNAPNDTIICKLLYNILAYLGAFLMYCILNDYDFLFKLTQILAFTVIKFGELFNCNWWPYHYLNNIRI